MSANDSPRLEARALERLLKPRSVAVVGASATPGALGAAVIANLDAFGYQGEIHLINPNRDVIGKRPCLKSVDELPLGVDAAVLAIPRAGVLPAVKALAARQAGALIIFSAGFAEGGAEGLEEQRELARIAKHSGMVIEGPNCLGFVNHVDKVALTFVTTPAVALGGKPGIGIISQSGAMAAVVSVTLASKQLAVSFSISTGNEAASGVEDYLAYLLEDASTACFGMIVEQFRQPQRFLKLARRAREVGKQIVLLHPGRSRAARESAATHTGAMAGDFQVMATQVRRQGVLLAQSLEEFGDLLDLSARCRVLPRGGCAVLTESGAFKALTLDFCEQVGLDLPLLDDTNAASLRAAMPQFVPVSNPVDLTAQALIDPDLYRRALEALLQDERFGSVVFGIIQTDAGTAGRKFPAIIGAIEQLKPRIPVIVAGLDDGAQVPQDYISRLHALGVSYFASPERAYRALARIDELAQHDARAAAAVELPAKLPLPPPGVAAEYRSKELLATAGVPFPVGRLVQTLEEAQAAASEWSCAVVLKAQSPSLPHKSEAGAVLVDLRDAAAIAAGWERLLANVERFSPGLRLDGVLVEKMGARGVELIIGGRNDRDWGPFLLVGFGGVQAEILQDVRLLPSGMSAPAIIAEILALKSASLLRGFRGAPAVDMAALARIVAAVDAVLRHEPRVREIDLNPVIAYPQGQGALALDALVVIE